MEKENYYLDIAETVLERGTCLKKNFGAIIVSNDEIISTGYSGAPRGRKNCTDLGFCTREVQRIPNDTMFEKCRSVHAEANAIISAKRNDMLGATLYLVGKHADSHTYIKDLVSCSMCKRLIINAGIETVIIRDDKEAYRVFEVCDWVYYDESLEHQYGY